MKQAESGVRPVICQGCGNYHNSTGSLVNCITDALRAMKLEIDRSIHSEEVAKRSANEALRRGETKQAEYTELLAQRCYESFSQDQFAGKAGAILRETRESGPSIVQQSAGSWSRLPDALKERWRKVASTMLVTEMTTMETVGE